MLAGSVPSVKRIFATLLVIVVLGFSWWLDQRPGSETAANDSGDSMPTAPADAIKLRVDHIYDGDTLRAEVLTANSLVATNKEIKVRLIGIDTPEKGECWADEARWELEKLAPRGSTIWAAPDEEARDRYGRVLFNLWNKDGKFIQYELTRNGHAEALRVWPNVAHEKLLRAAQRAAERGNLGQWETC